MTPLIILSGDVGFDPPRTQAGLGSASAMDTGAGQDLDPHDRLCLNQYSSSCYHETMGIYTRASVFSCPQGHAGWGL